MGDMELMEKVMKQVYGDWDDPGSGFPVPMSTCEAGPSGQWRYLWTDSFGILNFVIHRAESKERKDAYLKAADSLVEAVVKCLGAPRSPEFPMVGNDREGFKGMRIGKENARAMSDDGMTFDGMYRPYLDKWIFALVRLAQAKGEGGLDDVQELDNKQGPYFCRDLSCFKYFCRYCWELQHSVEVISHHKPLMRSNRAVGGPATRPLISLTPIHPAPVYDM